MIESRDTISNTNIKFTVFRIVFPVVASHTGLPGEWVLTASASALVASVASAAAFLRLDLQCRSSTMPPPPTAPASGIRICNNKSFIAIFLLDFFSILFPLVPQGEYSVNRPVCCLACRLDVVPYHSEDSDCSEPMTVDDECHESDQCEGEDYYFQYVFHLIRIFRLPW